MRITLTAVFCLTLIVGSLVGTEAWYPYIQRACVDCRGRLVWVGQEYFDGCNYCRCTSLWPRRAACTYRACKYNECKKGYPRRRY